MRGKGADVQGGVTMFGITPAYAGKSRPRQTAKKDCWDHPRLCGEKRLEKYACVKTWGSPPPMRGKGVSVQVQDAPYRITPAYAGKRRSPALPTA